MPTGEVTALLWAEVELLLDFPQTSASFLLELGNTISSLFGGGTSSDAKENGTDAVQVRAESRLARGWGWRV